MKIKLNKLRNKLYIKKKKTEPINQMYKHGHEYKNKERTGTYEVLKML